MKRVFDVSVALLGLTLVWPLFVVVAVLIKLEDGGPVFYRQWRVGRGGKRFSIWKFRSMVPNADQIGGQLTVGRDSRITRVGRCLRASKIDELPQLLNVLFGDMSFVGPRPEVPKYVSLYSEEQSRVLELRPGITDPASIKYFNESILLANSKDPERLYREKIMPDKVRMNLEYADRANVATDVLIVLRTLKRSLPKAA